MQYYDRLKAARNDNDLTQKQIAEKLLIKQQQYSEYEKGKRLIPITYLTEFCKITNTSADYILGLPEGLEYPKY